MRVFFAIGMLLVATNADAYVGPGLGLGLLGAILGALGALLLAIVGMVWYPVKRLLSRRKGPDRAPAAAGEREELDSGRQALSRQAER